MRALVIGYGSIGARHVKVLKEMGLNVAVVSRREIPVDDRFPTVSSALSANFFDYAVVCNETSAHFETLKELKRLAFDGKILVEKPLVQPHELQQTESLDSSRIFVAYNLRFDPLMIRLKEELEQRKIYSVEIRAASYLPDWRPGRDYRQTESAKKSLGGGVLRDMSHEIDFSQWLVGDWTELVSINDRLSSLEIDTDDACYVLARAKRCSAITMSMNYLDRTPEERRIIVNTDQGTYLLDLLNRVLRLNDSILSQTSEGQKSTWIDSTYFEEHRAVLAGDQSKICILRDGLQVARVIQAVEESSRNRSWVSIGNEV